MKPVRTGFGCQVFDDADEMSSVYIFQNGVFVSFNKSKSNKHVGGRGVLGSNTKILLLYLESTLLLFKGKQQYTTDLLF